MSPHISFDEATAGHGSRLQWCSMLGVVNPTRLTCSVLSVVHYIMFTKLYVVDPGIWLVFAQIPESSDVSYEGQGCISVFGRRF